MDKETAINAIKKNYPPENYTMLREALDMAIVALQGMPSGGERTTNSDNALRLCTCEGVEHSSPAVCAECGGLLW